MRPPSTGEDLTLYCLAHAGGSAAPYQRWAAFLPAGCRVVPLELPGHGTRLGEPLADDLDELVAGLLPTVRGAATERLAVFGHSFGALVAFELSRRLVRSGAPPAALLVAGRASPTGTLPRRPLHRLPDGELIAELSRYGGIPAELRATHDLLRVYLPAIRHDLRITETYTRPPGPAMGIPISAYVGRRDKLVALSQVFDWAHETTAEFDMSVLSSGHFLLTEEEFRSRFADRLRRLTHAPEPVSSVPPGAGGLAPSTL